ncbi:hypothetical protein Sa4125_43280 [Aureimonas sp. SA4125]|uniref:ImuA family protein n=1 Tax=Aureimonas sp. SA4125 TaxID=2826993 RepID=UPI001CC62442|nr:hypothetical protein [Aureimonas sp. SA4125]BDA86786.1 hypothetical protein Sa4125_43280 [Aureimonas sp. SA4125]
MSENAFFRGRSGEAAQRETVAELAARIALIEGRAVHRLEIPPNRLSAAAAPSMPAGVVPERDVGSAAIRQRRASFGVAAADEALAGGFPGSGLTEIHVDETRGSGSGAGFALALAVLFGASPGRPAIWIGGAHGFAEGGMPYGPGLAAYGLDPAGLVLVRTPRLEQAVWAGEEAARSPAPALTILEVRGNPRLLGLEGTRRLHLRAGRAGRPLLLLRQSGRPEATAAPLRLRIAPAPAAAVPDFVPGFVPGPVLDQARGRGEPAPKLIGHPVFAVTVEKARDGRSQHFLLQWNPHDRRFQALAQPPARHLAPAAVDGSDPARPSGSVLALRRAS